VAQGSGLRPGELLVTRQLKVYAMVGHRAGVNPNARGNQQTREIVAAHSVAEAMRKFKATRSEWNHSGGETGNALEVATAMSAPGVVFFAPLNHHNQYPSDWYAVVS
jgi:hypothetical protein